jgi:S-(hydroxymethyl)glutathione dehydrogenase / alcohol dehydrogenase
VAVFGAGPVGYFAVMSSFLRGAARVFSVDHWPTRLRKIKDLGAEIINFGKSGHDHSKVSNPAYEPANPLQVITWMCQTARKYSTIAIPGVYGSAYDKFPLGQLFNRELQIRIGQCPVKKYNEQLLHLIEVRRIDPTKLISHTMKLSEALKAYEIFDKKQDATKVVLMP